MKRTVGNKLIKLLFLGVLFLSSMTCVTASDTWITLTWENDFLAHEDSGYSNGLGISWGYGPFGTLENGPLPGWLETTVSYFPDINSPKKTYEMSYRIAQIMFTPEDLRSNTLIEDDRPYVGLLLLQANLHSYEASVSDRYWLTLGMVGPVSGAEFVQTTIHKLIGVKKPDGWAHQLDNELVFDISAERLWRLDSANNGDLIEFDIVGISAGDIGTLRSEIGAGLGFRLGRALERSFLAALVIPGRNINPLAANLKNEWHLFANFYGRYVLNDIVLDGNTFRDSHSVNLIHEQALFAIGASYHRKFWGIVVSFQDGTHIFRGQEGSSSFSSFSYTYRW